LVSNRNLVYENKEKTALELADLCKTPYSETIIREENGQEKEYHINFGYLRVKLPGRDDQLYILVVNGFGNKPMMLLTTEPLGRNKRILYRLLGYYLKRWSIEETIRFLKQTYDLENIRVLKYSRLRNMMGLLLAVFYFLTVELDMSQKLKIMTVHILKQAKRVFGVPDFKFYAIEDGLSNVFRRSPGKIIPYFNHNKDTAQLSFGFT